MSLQPALDPAFGSLSHCEEAESGRPKPSQKATDAPSPLLRTAPTLLQQHQAAAYQSRRIAPADEACLLLLRERERYTHQQAGRICSFRLDLTLTLFFLIDPGTHVGHVCCRNRFVCGKNIF
jgi:hypothetical protein